MNDLNHIWELVNQYPTCVPFYLFAFTACLMLLSLVTGIFAEIDSHFHIHLLDDILVSSGVSKVPLIIGLCLTFLPMTIITFLLQEPVFDLMQSLINDILFYAIATAYILVSFVICLFIGGFLSKPIASIIQNNTGSEVVNYLGLEAIVISNSVTSEYGRVQCEIGHTEHVLDAYSNEALVLNDKVLIVEKNTEKEKYLVKKA